MDERPQSGELLPARSLEQIGEELLEATVRFERLVVEGGLAVGQLLLEAKAQVGHGEWLPWLSRYWRWTPRHAQKLMRRAREERRMRTSSHLLEAPPPDLRREQGRLVAVVPEPPDRLEQATAVRRAQADLLFWSFIEDVCLDWGDSAPPAWLTSRAAEQIARRSRGFEEAGVPLAKRRAGLRRARAVPPGGLRRPSTSGGAASRPWWSRARSTRASGR